MNGLDLAQMDSGFVDDIVSTNAMWALAGSLIAGAIFWVVAISIIL